MTETQQTTLAKWVQAIFVLVLVGSIYHLVRDILQTFDLDSAFTDIAHRPHEWCGQYCDVVTIPLDVISIALSIFILKRQRVGITVGIALIATLLIGILFTLLP